MKTVSIYNRLIEIGIIFLIVFAPIRYGSVRLGDITIIELTVLFMLMIWGVGAVVRGNFAFIRTPLDIVFLIFCAYSVISALVLSGYTYASYRGLLLVLTVSALYFIVVNHIRSRAQLARLFIVIILVGFVHAFSHLVQNATGLFRSSTGTMFNVGNHFAGYIVVIIPLSIAMSFTVKDIGKRILLMFTGIIMAAAMAFALIAGAMLAFLFSLVLTSLLFAGSEGTRKQKFMLCGIVICLISIVLWFGYTPVLNELLTVTNLKTGSPAGRLSLWKSSLAIFADNPLTGTGLSTFDHIYPKYRLPDMYGRAVYAHSDWLQLLVELGAIGFVIVLLGLVLFTNMVRKKFPLLKSGDGWMKGIAVGGLCSIITGLTHALVEFNFHIPAIAILFTIILAITVAAFSGHKVSSGSNSREINFRTVPFQWRIQIPKPVRIGGSIFLFLMVGFCAIFILRPCVAEAYYQNGVEMEEDLLWDEAAGKYQSALGISPSNSDHFHALGNIYAKRVSLTKDTEMQGKWYGLAVDAYHEAIELCPTNGDYHLVLGNLHESFGNLEDAEADYLKSISLDPNNAFYRRIHGSFCLRQGEDQKAIAEYRKSLEIYPGDLSKILNEVHVNTKSDHPAVFKQSFLNIAQEVRPQNTGSHIALARFCESKGWYDDAISEYNRAIALSPEQINPWNQVSNLLIKQNRPDQAASLWQKFLSSHPRNAQAHAQLAAVYVRQNRLDDAIQQYLTAASIDPINSSYLNRAADLYTRQGKPDEAVKLWRTVIRQNPHESAEAHYRMGKYHEGQNDWIDALESFQQAISVDPKNVEYHLHLAQGYYKRELFYEAIQECELVLKLKPENIASHLWMARIYRHTNCQNKAEKYYQQVLRLQPGNIEAQKAIADSRG